MSDFFVTALHNIIKHNLIDDGEGNSKAVGDFYTIASPETAHILRIHILHVSYCGQTYLLGGCTSAITSDETNGAVHQNTDAGTNDLTAVVVLTGIHFATANGCHTFERRNGTTGEDGRWVAAIGFRVFHVSESHVILERITRCI